MAQAVTHAWQIFQLGVGFNRAPEKCVGGDGGWGWWALRARGSIDCGTINQSLGPASSLQVHKTPGRKVRNISFCPWEDVVGMNAVREG